MFSSFSRAARDKAPTTAEERAEARAAGKSVDLRGIDLSSIFEPMEEGADITANPEVR